MDKTTKGVVTQLKDWAKHPVDNDMNLVDVTLTTILVVSVAFLWTRVLNQITE